MIVLLLISTFTISNFSKSVNAETVIVKTLRWMNTTRLKKNVPIHELDNALGLAHNLSDDVMHVNV